MAPTPHSLQHLISTISGGHYALSLADVDSEQILYNGKITYLTNYARPSSGGWCHLLLLTSKNRYSKQVLAILTQTRDSDISIVNVIEDIATFVLNFFRNMYPPLVAIHHGEEEPVSINPANVIFVEYLPAGCFGPNGSHDEDTFAIMNFVWEEIHDQHIGSYFQAKEPSGKHMWRHASLEELNDLIARL